MIRPICRITFTAADSGKKYIFDEISSFETAESFENLTDTFKITLPLNVRIDGKPLFNGTDPVFRRGDFVKVESGYYPSYRTVFEGYVAQVSPKIPVTITCEDDMFLLKNTNVTYPSKRRIQYYRVKKNGDTGAALKRPKIITEAVTLKQLLDNIMPDNVEYSTNIECNLGKFVVTNASVSKVLEELRSKYGLYSYFRNHILYVGLPNNAADTNTEEFIFESLVNPVINDDDLEYQLAKDLDLKIVAKMIGLNNTFEEVTVGATDGAVRTFHLFWDGKSAKPDLTAFANLKLEEVRYDGWRGSFPTLGEPYVRHGDIVKLSSKRYPERDGSYLVSSVKRSQDTGSGYKQRIYIANRVSA